MLTPFLERHVALAKPDVLVVMGNTLTQAVLGKRGITRLRGQWDRAWELPVMPMFHPAYLLRQPQAKRQAWADLLELKARLAVLELERPPYADPQNPSVSPICILPPIVPPRL